MDTSIQSMKHGTEGRKYIRFKWRKYQRVNLTQPNNLISQPNYDNDYKSSIIFNGLCLIHTVNDTILDTIFKTQAINYRIRRIYKTHQISGCHIILSLGRSKIDASLNLS